MNPKQMRKIRHKAKAILLAWVTHVVKKEHQSNITSEKFKLLLNTISYKWEDTTKVLQPMSYRWLVQTLKKLHQKKRHPYRVPMCCRGGC